MNLSADGIYKIKSRLFAYSPNLAQSWALAIIASLGGAIINAVVVAFLSQILQHTGLFDILFRFFNRAIDDYIRMFGWLLTVGFVVMVVDYFGRRINYAPVQFPRQSPLLLLLLMPFILSVGILTEPLATLVLMPRMYAKFSQINLPVFLIVIIIWPVYKEWLYRGIILKGLLAHYSPLRAIMWSVVIFGLSSYNLWGVPTAFCFSIAIGWVYWQTRSLWHCIFMHAVGNVIEFLFITPMQIKITYTDLAGGYYIYPVALLVCVLSVMGIKKIVVPYDITSESRG